MVFRPVFNLLLPVDELTVDQLVCRRDGVRRLTPAPFDINYKLFYYVAAYAVCLFEILFRFLLLNVHNSTTTKAKVNTSTDLKIVKVF